MRRCFAAVLLLALVLPLAASASASSLADDPSSSLGLSPLAPPVLGANGVLLPAEANPLPSAEALRAQPLSGGYSPARDFLGPAASLPLNPRHHLQRLLSDDRLYVASILRSPLDLGDPLDCKHSDVLRDEKALRRMAMRINHRRVALRQQQNWIDSASEGLAHVESEIASGAATARNLAEQLDALTAQKNDITAHVRRAQLLQELDNTSANLMRLKDARVGEEVQSQARHNERATRNAEHNKVLQSLGRLRKTKGFALGKIDDPKPYALVQQAEHTATAADDEASKQEDQAALEVASTDATETEADESSDAVAEQEAEADSEAEGEAETEGEQEADADAEADESAADEPDQQ